MKKIIRSSLRLSVFALMIITTLLVVDFQTDLIMANHNSKSSNQPLLKVNDVDLKFFDISDFTNTSHQIGVNKYITANQYGYTSSRTEIDINNSANQAINAFNFTLPTTEYDDTKYIKIYSTNDTEVNNTSWDVVSGDTTTVFIIQFPTVDVGEKIQIIIEMDHPSAISFEEDAVLEEATYPYKFNLSFMPLISLPITNFNLEWKIGAEIQISVKNETIRPTEANFTGEFIQELTLLKFEDVQELTSINRSLLNQSIYGGYNLTALSGLSFIPAYQQNMAINHTLFLNLDYFQSAATFMTFSSLKTTIEISEWGTVYITQEIIVKNVGVQSGGTQSSAIGSITFPLLSFNIPETANYIGLTDNYGNITPTVTRNSVIQKKLIEFRPRIQIEQNAEYHLYLSYRESSEDIIESLGSGKLRILIAPSMNFNWTIQHLELELLFPSGSSISLEDIQQETKQSTLRDPVSNSSIQKPEFLGLFNKIGYSFVFQEFTPLSNNQMTIEFGVSPFYPLHTPLALSVFILAIGLIYAVIRNYTFGIKTKKFSIDEIPLDLIKNFVKSYEEKTALREQLLRLDRKRKSKNVTAREYEQTRIILRNQQRETDRTLVSVSRKLSDEGPRFRVSMRSIEVAEASREDYLINIESLEKKKTQGRIGKEAYARLKIDYGKKLKKSNNSIDKVLIELRNLLTK
ncbi:MAG: hypothetical protein KAT16_00330 [Candidatus Heimdallarchaeota archaeon]|nr:hypothetical protein [Candidatus Heimdallarchaeota archaeon]